MLVVALEPELYLKSARTRRRMVSILSDNIVAALGAETRVSTMSGHRLRIDSERGDAAEALVTMFGVAAVEHVEPFEFTGLEDLAARLAKATAERVREKRFAVRPKRLGKHEWRSQDLAVRLGALLVEAGGTVDLSHPEETVLVRVVEDTAYLTIESTPAVGGLPTGTQGRALVMFSGGIDSPVAAYLMARRGVALDYLHFSLGCGQADHAAGIAHALWEQYGAGSDPTLFVSDLEPAIDAIKARVRPRDRQMALKAVMYRTAEGVAAGVPPVRAVVNGESLGQVSTQTLDNLTTLDRLVGIPMLRPLVGLDKQQIRAMAVDIGTYGLSERTREMCDISEGSKVSVNTTPRQLAAIGAHLDDLVEEALTTTKATRLADWSPGA